MGIFRQFPYSNFHEMNMDQIIKIMREMQDEWAETKTEWASYKDFIDNYFATLDVSKEVLAAIRVMAADGSLNTIIDPVIASETADWLAEHITVTTGATVIDDTLSIAGAAADAKAAGDRLTLLDQEIIDRTDTLYDEINYNNLIKQLPLLNDLSNYVESGPRGQLYLSNRILPKYSKVNQLTVNISEDPIRPIYIVIYDINTKVVKYTKSATVTRGLHNIPINYICDSDCSWGFYGVNVSMYRTSGVTASDYSFSTAGLMQATVQTPAVGDVLTIETGSNNNYYFYATMRYALPALTVKQRFDAIVNSIGETDRNMPPISSDSSAYDRQAPGTKTYVCKRTIPANSLIKQFVMTAIGAGQLTLCILNADTLEVLDVWHPDLIAGLNTFTINKAYPVDVFWGARGYALFNFAHSALPAEYNMTPDGLYESANTDPKIGDVLTLERTSTARWAIYAQMQYTELNQITNIADITSDVFKIQLFGDSITDTLWGDNITWATLLHDYFKNRQCIISNNAIAGGRIASMESHHGIYDLICDSQYRVFNPDQDLYILFAGTNDWGSSGATPVGNFGDSGSTLMGALELIIKYISTNNPAGKIIVVTPPARDADIDADKAVNNIGEKINSTGLTLREYAARMQEVCSVYGIPCLNLNSDIGWNSINIDTYTVDGLHPNTVGDNEIAIMICNEIKKHYINVI